MPKYDRFLAMVQNSVWLIEPNRAAEMMAALELRIEQGSRAEAYLTPEELEANRARSQVQRLPMPPSGKSGRMRDLAIIPMVGTILPRGDAMTDMSGGGAVNLTRFQNEFLNAANDESVGAIMLEIDSPGGQVDLVQETAALIRANRKAGRPIVAMANTMAASAAYWIAAAADEVVVTPSGSVGSIGVFQVHQNVEGQAAMLGVGVEYIYEGARKVEGNPFGPLSDTARAAYQKSVRDIYEQFTADVASYRGASVRTVRADPEATQNSFGGGRAYGPQQLKEMGLIGSGGMVDRVATVRDTINRLMGRSSRTSTTKARLALS